MKFYHESVRLKGTGTAFRCVPVPFEHCIEGHLRSSVVVPINFAYDFLSALNSNLPSVFNHSEISRLVYRSMCNWNWNKTGRWTCVGVRVPKTLDYPCNHKRMITMHARPRRTDRQTDRRTNIMARLATARRFVLKRTHRAPKR